MGTHLHDVYYCNMNRYDDLNKRLTYRNVPTKQLETMYISRPADTYCTKLGVVDQRKKNFVKKARFDSHDPFSSFNPGSKGPNTGFTNNVDVESKLSNRFSPLQKCVRGKYIPSSNSDMYNTRYLTYRPRDNFIGHNLLFQNNNFAFFNPNECNLGKDMFYNHTRQQQKNVEPESMKKESSE
jgi:hypothetical protein